MFKPSEHDDFSKLSRDELLEVVRVFQAENIFLKNELFGKKSEKRDPGKTIFDEAELYEDEIAEESASTSEDPSSGGSGSPKGKKGSNRKPLPKDLPRRRVELELDEKDSVCSIHGTRLVKIGEKISEKLEIVPAKIEVVEYARFTYKCPCCSQQEDKQTIVSAPAEASILGKSFVSASLLAFIIVSKFQDSLPLNRLSVVFGRHGIDIARSTMAKWVIKAAEKLIPLINLMTEDSLERKVLGCDETPVQVLDEPNRKAEQKSYMWVTATMEGPPIILYNYHTGRGAKVAEQILAGYSGTIVCDGLKSYDCFANTHESVILAACMAHIRRKFFQAEKAAKKADPKKKPKAAVALDMIRQLYKIEEKIKDFDPENRLAIRQDESQKLMNQLEGWLQAEQGRYLPKSLLGKAINYALTQWPKMKVFLYNPYVHIDNNLTEGYIRQFVIGRNNWMFSQSPKGADASANLYSLVVTAKANGLDPFSYLLRVFKELPKADTIEAYEKLLPYNIASHFEIKTYAVAK